MVEASDDGGTSAWFGSASGGTRAVVTPRIPGGEGAFDPGAARLEQQTSRKAGRSAANPAKLRLCEFQKININPRLVDATPMSNQTRCSGERMPRQLERRTCGPSAWNGAGSKRVQAGSTTMIRVQSDHLRCSARRDVDERRRGVSERRRGGYSQRTLRFWRARRSSCCVSRPAAAAALYSSGESWWCSDWSSLMKAV